MELFAIWDFDTCAQITVQVDNNESDNLKRNWKLSLGWRGFKVIYRDLFALEYIILKITKMK